MNRKIPKLFDSRYSRCSKPEVVNPDTSVNYKKMYSRGRKVLETNKITLEIVYLYSNRFLILKIPTSTVHLQLIYIIRNLIFMIFMRNYHQKHYFSISYGNPARVSHEIIINRDPRTTTSRPLLIGSKIWLQTLEWIKMTPLVELA